MQQGTDHHDFLSDQLRRLHVRARLVVRRVERLVLAPADAWQHRPGARLGVGRSATE